MFTSGARTLDKSALLRKTRRAPTNSDVGLENNVPEETQFFKPDIITR